MNADQFKAYWMDRYQKEKAVLDSHTELSDAYRTLLHNSLKKTWRNNYLVLAE